MSDGDAFGTINHRLRAVRAFCTWVVDTRRLTLNPVTGVALLNAALDKRHSRGSFTVDELVHLFAVVDGLGTHHGLTGRGRVLVYWLAVETGLRYSEMCRLKKYSFDLDDEVAVVRLGEDMTKNEDPAVLPIRSDLAALLREYLSDLEPQSRAFRLWPGKGAPMLQVDLKAAGIPYVDERGRYRDFHAFRKTFGTLLNKGKVQLSTAQRMMRHSDPRLTSNIYTDVVDENKVEALSSLPSLGGQLIRVDTRVDTPVDTQSPDSGAKIRTYKDGWNANNRERQEGSKTKKPLCHRGKQG